MRRLRAIVVSALVVGGAGLFAVAGAGPAQAAPVICEKFGGTYIQNNTRRVQNNVWGADTAQCIDVNQNGGFTVTQAGHNNATNGAPAAYPSIYAGCHWAQCTSGSSLPMQASSSQFAGIQTSVSMTYPSSGTWNAAYDLWFDPTPRTDGQNTGAEIMVWLNYQGSIQPIGSPVATVTLAGGTWQVWFGNVGWNVISYRRTSPTTSVNFAVNTFLSDAISRGYAQRSWYLTSVQAGFEPWVGGAGLAVNSFSYSVGGTGGDTTPPSTPGTPSASNVTSSGATLSWAASTDTGGSGLAGYDVFREQGATDPLLASSSTNSVNLTGLSASTQYQVYVRARDGAGNTSGNSALGTFTTGGGGGDTTPPSTPGTPSASNVTSSAATLTWAGSTDTGGSGLAGYNVYREQGATDPLLASPTTNSVTLTGLSANTQYQVYVRARDGAGNLSGTSGLVTFTTQGGGGGGCTVTFTGSPWNETPTSGGFTWNFTIRNGGTTTLSNWRLTVPMPANHTLTPPGWNATFTVSGSTVTGAPVSHNVNLAPGASTTVGFNGRWSGSYSAPSGLTCG